MSAGCCQHEPKFDGATKGFRRALWVVIGINASMFVVEMIAVSINGYRQFYATIILTNQLFVLGMSVRVRTTAALLKGVSLALMGLWVFGSTAYQVLVLGLPSAPVMGAIGVLALAANLASVGVLLRYKDGDANVRSVWLCSRNDAIGNVAVMLAAGGVFVTGTAWPDLAVAGLMAGLFLWSSIQIIAQALKERQHTVETVAAE